jgi:molybdenum cofactor biosynthesis enzyme MoaA
MAVDQSSFRATKETQQVQAVTAADGERTVQFNQSDVVALSIWIGFGIDKVRLTGGEPLVRRGIVRLVGMLSEIAAGTPG